MKDEYGWWKKPLPLTYGHSNNYVMTKEELIEYAGHLKELRAVVEKEYSDATFTLRILSGADIRFYQNIPRLHCTCSALEFFVRMGKQKLALMGFINKFTARGKDDGCGRAVENCE
jgi:hypothetical protein